MISFVYVLSCNKHQQVSPQLQIWDTAGQERFRSSLLNQFYRSADAVVFVYDVTKISTFEDLPTWMDECERHIDLESTPKAIIGNKLVIFSKLMQIIKMVSITGYLVKFLLRYFISYELLGYIKCQFCLLFCRCDMESRVNLEVVRRFADMHKMARFETSAVDPAYRSHINAIFETLAFKLFKSKEWTPIAVRKPGGIRVSKLVLPLRSKDWKCC